MKYYFKHSLTGMLSLALLSACAVGPDYVRPKVATPTKFKEAKNKEIIVSAKSPKWKVATPRDADKRGEWWRVFNDPQLNKLEAQLANSNQTIQAAIANYRQALALVDEARASFFPTLTGALALTRQKGTGTSTFISSGANGSTSTGVATGGVSTGGSRIYSSHFWTLNANWEPDIWGQVRRTVEANVSAAQASNALLGATQLSAQGSLAQIYFELRAADSDQKFLNDTVHAYQRAMKLTRNQYQAGIVARGDMIQAESQLETAQAAAVNNRINRATYEHAIAVLIGVPPAEFSLPAKPLRQLPPPIPVSLPSELLERRPDIAQAERLMAQANAQIGVAVSAYFPTIPLVATATSSANNAGLSELFKFPMVGWTFGPQITQLIFDGGLRAATTRAARAGYDSSVANYRQVVLTAFQEVEDNLATLRTLNEQSISQNKAANSARQALQFVMNQYKAGLIAYTDVITAQINAFNAEKAAIDLTGLRMTAAVALIKSLGGSWAETCLAQCNAIS